jgi:hypothetical protein
MNPATFLQNCDRVITGHGFRRVIQGLNINSLRLATGGILAVDSGNPQRRTLETYFEGVRLASSQTDLGSLTFQIPRDYDESVDKLYIRFLANSGGDTNTPTIDAAMYRKRAEAALSADIDPTISGAVNNNTNKADWVEIVSEDDGWKAGDAVTCLFTSSAHTTDNLEIYGLEVVYASDLVYYEDSERSISE